MLPLRKLQYAAGAAGLLVLATLIVARTTAQSPPSDLVLIASSAIQAEIVPCGWLNKDWGGLARRASLYEKLRNENNAVLIVDAGDFGRAGQGDALGWPFTDFVASMLGRLKVDVWTPGERELYYGAGSLELLAGSAAGSEVVSANVAGLNGKLLFRESTVKKVGSLRVGVTGVSRISWPDVPPPAGGRYGEFRFLDPGTSLRKAVEKLQSKSDLVVVLAHLSAGEADSLARLIPGIDAIVVGHNPGYVAVQQAGPSLLVRPANMGKQIARAHLKVSDGKIVDYKGFEDVLKESVPDDPLIAKDVAAFRAKHGIKDPPKAVVPPAAAGGH